jgi:hypothetical protein
MTTLYKDWCKKTRRPSTWPNWQRIQ